MKLLTTSAIGALLLVAIASPSQADGSDHVRWKTIIGIAQAGNMVGGVTGRSTLVGARRRRGCQSE